MVEAPPPKTRMERIEATIAKLASNQLHVTNTLDELIHRITMLEARQHQSPIPPSSSSAKTVLKHTPITPLSLTPPLPPPLKPPQSPPLTAPTPLPTPPPQPALMLKHTTPLPTPFPMPVPHLAADNKHQLAHMSSSIFTQLSHLRAVTSLHNLFGFMVHYGREAAPHDKILEHKVMALFETGIVPYGSAMVARKCQPATFTLRKAADPKEPCRYRPWDPGRPRRTRNTLRTRCFRMGVGML
ncbi:hypothetical protein HKD37_01G001047 [Glycine soja]|nr:hypothetical protein GmHk_01G001056 [Glycine max]